MKVYVMTIIKSNVKINIKYFQMTRSMSRPTSMRITIHFNNYERFMRSF